MTAEIDWDLIRTLARRVLEQGESLELTDTVRALLRRSAQEVAISLQDAEDTLRNLSTAAVLLQEIRRRIDDGAQRLVRATNRAYDLRDAGNLDEACRQLESVLAVEGVPLYRQQAESVLKTLTRLKAVAASGQVDPTLNDRAQIPILLHRVQQSHPLELNDGMRAFLQRAAASVAMTEAEIEEALTSPEHAGALLETIMGRLREGADRIKRALSRMCDLRDAGDLEGARQQLLDVLAVEVVPKFRRMAEESLETLG